MVMVRIVAFVLSLPACIAAGWYAQNAQSDIVEHANAVAMKTTEAEYWLKTQQQLNLDAERFYEFFRRRKQRRSTSCL